MNRSADVIDIRPYLNVEPEPESPRRARFRLSALRSLRGRILWATTIGVFALIGAVAAVLLARRRGPRRARTAGAATAERVPPTPAENAAPTALAAGEIRRRALAERPVVRFLDDTQPAAPRAPMRLEVRERHTAPIDVARASRATFSRGGRMLQTLDSRVALAGAWAACAIGSLAIAIATLLAPIGSISIATALVPTVVGFGALVRYVVVAIVPSRRATYRRRG